MHSSSQGSSVDAASLELHLDIDFQSVEPQLRNDDNPENEEGSQGSDLLIDEERQDDISWQVTQEEATRSLSPATTPVAGGAMGREAAEQVVLDREFYVEHQYQLLICIGCGVAVRPRSESLGSGLKTPLV